MSVMGLRGIWVALLLTFLISTQLNGTESGRSPIKTILGDDGDIIDCVHLYSQPAFSHPALKNHTVQARPSSDMDELVKNRTTTSFVYQPWTDKGECPEGTVPILRSPLNDTHITKPMGYARPSSVKAFNEGHEYAVMYQDYLEVYGSQANINIWDPYVETNRMFSLAQTWIAGGRDEAVNTIEVGWHVYPKKYGGSTRPRIFIYWTRDGYQKTGCYNLQCAGFVQVSKKIVPGAALSSVSQYKGKQYDLPILVFRDKASGNWWMVFGGTEFVGYWPMNIFTYLKYKADSVEWGGEIYNDKKTSPHTTTHMGSGYFPSQGGTGISAYFSRVHYVDSNNIARQPSLVSTSVTNAACYNIKVIGDTRSTAGFKFYYGGLGKNFACP